MSKGDTSQRVDVWMPLYVKDYLAATSRLTTEQHGAYLLLIMDYWMNGPLPDDDAALSQIARLSPEKWEQSTKQALSRHFEVGSGVWSHSRIDAEVEKALSRRSRAKAGAAGKWGDKKANENRKTRSQRLSEARAKGTHTQQEWAALKDFCGNACVSCGSTESIVKDHIKPIYQGGSDAIENLQPLCKSCNSSKGPDSSDLRPNGWQNACKTPAKRLLDGSTAPAPAQSPSQSKTGKSKPLSGKPDRSVEIESVFAYWQERCEHPRAKLDDKRRKAIRARLKDGYTADDLKRAVDGCAVSAWHQGDNDRAQKFDDIELICRDGKHVDQFLKIADDPAAGSGMGSAGRKTAAAAMEFLND